MFCQVENSNKHVTTHRTSILFFNAPISSKDRHHKNRERFRTNKSYQYTDASNCTR